MEEVKEKNKIALVSKFCLRNFDGNHRAMQKTMEMQREVFHKFMPDNCSTHVYNFHEDIDNKQFFDIAMVFAGERPKNMSDEMYAQITNMGVKIDADTIFFIDCNVVMTNSDWSYWLTIDGNYLPLVGYQGFGGFDFFHVNRAWYRKYGSPPARFIQIPAHLDRQHDLAVVYDIKSKLNSEPGEYVLDMDDQFNYRYDWAYVVNRYRANWYEKYWEVCEQVLTEGMYENRSIEH